MKRNKILKKMTAGRSGTVLVGIYCMILCAAMLVSSTLAWFQQNIRVKDNMIVTGEYGVEVTVTEISAQNTSALVTFHSTGTGAEDEDERASKTIVTEDGVYTLAAGKAYHVTLTATGTAERGYCMVTVSGTGENDIEYTYTYSPQLLNGKDENGDINHGAMSFTLNLGNAVEIDAEGDGASSVSAKEEVKVVNWQAAFSPSWGTCDVADSATNNDGTVQIGKNITVQQTILLSTPIKAGSLNSPLLNSINSANVNNSNNTNNEGANEGNSGNTNGNDADIENAGSDTDIEGGDVNTGSEESNKKTGNDIDTATGEEEGTEDSEETEEDSNTDDIKGTEGDNSTESDQVGSEDKGDSEDGGSENDKKGEHGIDDDVNGTEGAGKGTEGNMETGDDTNSTEGVEGSAESDSSTVEDSDIEDDGSEANTEVGDDDNNTGGEIDNITGSKGSNADDEAVE